MERAFKFNLGDTLKDIITGFEGVAMARSQYFTGCHHYGLCPSELTKDGKEPDWMWVDESRLALVDEKTKVLFNADSPSSGPHPNPPKA